MENNTFTITGDKIDQYIQYLKSEESADNTIDKYARDIGALAAYLGGAPVTKEGAVAWKESLGATHGAASINSMLAAANGLFAYYGLGIMVKPLRTQTSFLPDGRVLTKEEYERLLWAAEAAGDERLYHMIQSKYQQDITRAEFCALATALYENQKGTITGRTTFTDTKDVNVEKMAFVGVVSGVGNNTFSPKGAYTREQSIVTMLRMYNAMT